MGQETLNNKIRELVEEFFREMTFEAKIEVFQSEEKIFQILLTAQDPQILIGSQGETLFLLQQVLTLILRRKISQDLFLDLDINEYKKKKIEYLKDLARTVAREVALTKKEKALFPMPAYARRIVHLELANQTEVKTESIGEGLERRVVVRPVA